MYKQLLGQKNIRKLSLIYRVGFTTIFLIHYLNLLPYIYLISFHPLLLSSLWLFFLYFDIFSFVTLPSFTAYLSLFLSPTSDRLSSSKPLLPNLRILYFLYFPFPPSRLHLHRLFLCSFPLLSSCKSSASNQRHLRLHLPSFSFEDLYNNWIARIN